MAFKEVVIFQNLRFTSEVSPTLSPSLAFHALTFFHSQHTVCYSTRDPSTCGESRQMCHSWLVVCFPGYSGFLRRYVICDGASVNGRKKISTVFPKTAEFFFKFLHRFSKNSRIFNFFSPTFFHFPKTAEFFFFFSAVHTCTIVVI